MDKIFGEAYYETNATLSAVSTFKIGGPADFLVKPANRAELVSAVKEADKKGIRYMILGNGSNVLFDDKGYRGAVILTSGMKNFAIIGNEIFADCGASVTAVSRAAAEKGLSGLEFACGIPGTVGGAVVMNAGAYGGQISDVLVSSDYFDSKDGNSGIFTLPEHRYGYRESVYLSDDSLVVLSARFALGLSDRETAVAKCEANLKARSEKQPLSYPSAGSVFKRPVGNFAGKLIEDAGLKGRRIGGAAVSEKHAGFIVNLGGATSSDVLELIEVIKSEVYRTAGVMLECEVRHIAE